MININKVIELKDYRTEYEKILKNEYKKFYMNVRRYIFKSNILEIQKEEVMSDVIEMFIDYQENDKDIESLLGDDHEKFCIEIIESLKTTKLGKAYALIKGIEILIGVIVLEFGIITLSSRFKISGFERIDSLDFITFVVLGIFIGISIGKYRIRNIYTPWSINKLEFLKDIRFLGIGVLVAIIIEHSLISKFFDFYVNDNVMMLIVLIGLSLLFMLNIIKVIFAKGIKL